MQKKIQELKKRISLCKNIAREIPGNIGYLNKDVQEFLLNSIRLRHHELESLLALAEHISKQSVSIDVLESTLPELEHDTPLKISMSCQIKSIEVGIYYLNKILSKCLP